MPVTIRQIPCLQDNYAYLVRDDVSGAVAAIDTPDVDAINGALETQNWRLTHILNTHHHWDHAGGNLALKERWGCEIIAPAGEVDKIPGVDRAVREGDIVMLGQTRMQVHETPGHTNGHIIYHLEEEACAFVGDTIFALGCGRLFEGTPEEMWTSLSKIAQWPAQTKLYCAHEYTQANARFALSINPDNEALQKRAEEIDAKRARNEPTVPMTVGQERQTSPFLRAGESDLKAALGMMNESDVTVFTEVRKRKDMF